MYTRISAPGGGFTPGIRRDADGAFIPADERSPEWQAYQAWLADGNAPADPVGPGAAVPPDCLSLPWWRSALKYWLRPDGNGGTIARFADVDAAIARLETAANADGTANVALQRAGVLAREQFEYANGAVRADLLKSAAAFGFTAADVDESLWRADRVRQGDLSGVWPPPFP